MRVERRIELSQSSSYFNKVPSSRPRNRSNAFKPLLAIRIFKQRSEGFCRHTLVETDCVKHDLRGVSSLAQLSKCWLQRGWPEVEGQR